MGSITQTKIATLAQPRQCPSTGNSTFHYPLKPSSIEELQLKTTGLVSNPRKESPEQQESPRNLMSANTAVN